MRLIPERSDTPTQIATLGRLGGLTTLEAERGERALWLAGDGYRAALFHLGALTRLNELGLLARVGAVGAVSGGSIIAALLAARVQWPLHGTYREWPEQVARPMREIARRNARARAFLRKPFPAAAAEAALEERYARDLLAALGGEPRWGPNFIFGASGLTLSGLAAGWEECVEWEIGGTACPPGYPSQLVAAIAAVRTDLDAFGEAEQAVLENHGYLLADAALRAKGLVACGGIVGFPPEPPHPGWMSEGRAGEALATSSKRKAVGRLRPRRARRGGRSPQYRDADLVDLLKRHRPLLRYDSLESFRAGEAEAICGLALPGRCNTLHRADGALIAAAEPRGEEPKLHLGFLGGPAYANGAPARRGDYLDECGASHAGDALDLRRRLARSDLVYGHARHDEDGRLWLQYWLFFYFDDKGLLGIEQHEGDWEVLQIRIGEKGRRPAMARLPWSIRPGGLTRRCRAPAASRPPPLPITTTASGRWRDRGWRRSATTGRAGRCGREGGARRGGGSASRGTARAGRGSIPVGGIRRGRTARPGPGGGPPRPNLRFPARHRRRSGSRRGRRAGWRWSATPSPG